MGMTAIASLAIVVSAALAIAAGPSLLALPVLLFIFKPLTTALIIATALRRTAPADAIVGAPVWRRGIVIGLLLSLVGDIALLWPREGFLPGLVAFLLAHLAYIVAFSRGTRLATVPAPFAAYGLVSVAILSSLWTGLPPPLRLPVLAYVVALATMAAQAAGVAWVRRSGADAAAARDTAVGAGLFVVSDALLAIDRFATPLVWAGPAILVTYWSAQALIAASLGALKRSDRR
jgi:uncharacterized membrane protein YhhN